MAHEHANPGAVMDLLTFGETMSTALVKEREFESILLRLEPGRSIPEHKVDGPITVQCVSGACAFTVGGEPREMVAGSWLYLRGGALHALQANEPCTLLVTIMFPHHT